MTVLVDDGRGGIATQSFVIQSREVPPNDEPQISSTPPTVGTVGQPYGYFVDASDVNRDPLQFSLQESPSRHDDRLGDRA